MPYCLVFLCIQIDWFCSGALQGSPLHNSIWPPAGAPLGTCSDYRGKGKRWGRELKQHARSQEFPNLSRTLVRLGGSRMAAKWLGAVVPPPPGTPAAPHHGWHCRASSHWVFSVRSLFLFLLPTQFPPGKLVVYIIGVKSKYGLGSTDLSEDFFFCGPEWSTLGGGLAWSTSRTSRGRCSPAPPPPSLSSQVYPSNKEWRRSANPEKEDGGSSKK